MDLEDSPAPLIREAKSGDAARIAEIYNSVVSTSIFTFDGETHTEEEQIRWLKRHLPNYPVIVAEAYGYVVGWASVAPWGKRTGYDKTVELSFFVDEAHRGQGLGRLLLEGIVEAGIEKGLKVFISRIVVGNDPSIHLHETSGFDYVGIQKKVGHKLGAWHDVVLFQKNCF
jgi:phosphinothricin acetyltransferase